MLKRVSRPAALIAAWVFLAASVWPLAADLGWPPHRPPAQPENTYILRIVVDGTSYTSWGLTYIGELGHRLRLAELAGVLLGAALSLLPWNGPRRLGLLVLVAWAGLWFGNAVRMAVIAPIHVMFLAALFTFLFFVATVARAGLSWNRWRGANGAGNSRDLVMRSD